MAASRTRRRRAAIAVAFAGLLAAISSGSVTATTPSITIDVSGTGEVQVGDTLTLTPVVSNLDSGTPHRCFMWIEFHDSGADWMRMQVSGDACEPWTLTVPPSPIGQYIVHGRLYYGSSGTGPAAAVDAADSILDILDGGTPVPFTTNYPVQSWDLVDMVSTSSPQYGQPFTIEGMSGVDSCVMRILG